ncbi:MAG: sensor histidine kinase [Anaerolineaceae bacterium]|nr:sensor histidine kinase [Anaerolineaceae bacterium]
MREREKENKKPIHLGNGVDIAFLLVVLAAYFAIFSSLPTVTISQLITMNVLGISYLLMGIYGYKYILDTDNRLIQFGYFTIQLILGGLIIYLGSTPESEVSLNSLLLLPLAVQSVVMLPQAGMLAVNAFILLLYSISNIKYSGSLSELMNSLPVFFIGQIFIVFFTQIAVTEQNSREEINRLVFELEKANQHLKEYALQVEELAVTRERNRLAREIHDGLGHYLTSIFMQVQAARAMLNIDPVKAADLLEKAQSLSQEALTDVRNSVSTLRSPLLENISLPVALEQLIEQSQFNEIQVKFNVLGEARPISARGTWTIYRTLQEGINNTVKYSMANQLEIILDYQHLEMVSLIINDDGVGTNNLNGGFGIIGIKERVKLLEGHCKFTSSEGNGFSIQIGIPG